MTRLLDQVWTQDRCAGCGLCVAACSKQVLEWDGEDHPRLRHIAKNIGLSKFDLDTCSFCQKFCEAVCPRLEPAARLQPLTTVAARAVGTLPGGEPNDIVRNLLVAARGSGMIDGALMMDADQTGTTQARVVSGAGEIAQAVGFQQIWTPLLEMLNRAVFDFGLTRLAVVSTPCGSQALRRLHDSKLERLAPYQKAIRLNVSLFCTGVYPPHSIRELVETGLNVPLASVRSITALPRRNRLRVDLWDSTTREMDLVEADKSLRAGCARCDDYLGESADVAVGCVGAPEGAATVVARTPAGVAAVQNALQMKLLETEDAVDGAALARASAEKGRRERAQAFDRLRILMLDAVRDPRQRAQVRRELDLLYGTTRSTLKKEDDGNAGCGDCSGC